MRILIDCLLRVVLCLAGLSFIHLDAAADPIDDYVRSEMEIAHAPGLAIAVTRGGSVVKLAGYGLADVELEAPVTPGTVFQIQSVTKQFVATAIMKLVEEGKISVDDKVSKHLTGTPNLWKAITVRHLLTHTSGIKDFINEPTASLRLEVTDDEVFTATAARPLNFEPGDKYAYSNSNYHLLAMIIRKLTGESYGSFLKKYVFEPLGMHQTRVMSWTDIVPHRAAGYNLRDGQLCNGEFIAGSILAYGGGGLLSTAEDMAKWDMALRGETLLKKSTLEQMWSPTRLNDGTLSHYGFGWGTNGQAPHRSVQHSGGHMTGFTSAIARFLDDDLSVIVLVNAGFANPARIAYGVAAIYVPELKAPERKPIEDKEPSVTELLKETERLLRAGRLEKQRFTPEMFAALEPSLQETATEMQSVGPLKTVELLERTTLSNGARQYVYRMRFTRRTVLVHLTLNQASQIAAITQEPE